MPLTDLPLSDLRSYAPDVDEPADFDSFWAETIAEADAVELAVESAPARTPVRHVEAFDVSFAGWAGDRISAWLLLPPGSDVVGCVVRYLGYGGGRGLPHQHLAFPTAGWATLVMDTRGQGTSPSMPGSTGDPHGGDGPTVPGVMTRGVSDPRAYYYRRLFVDAHRAVDVAARHERVDAERIVVAGHSQAGAMAQAVAALRSDVAAALIDAPFLTHVRRGAEAASGGPYLEIAKYLASHREDEARLFRTMSYFDGVNFAGRGRVPALYSIGLMDEVTPPSTVFAAYNRRSGDKEIDVWPWNAHEAGDPVQWPRQCAFLDRVVGR